MKYILSIDQGTTGSRAVVYDKKGLVIASSYQEFKQIFPKPGWVEHDPEDIWKSVNSTIEKVLKIISPMDIASIGITNQRETTVVWDRITGKPIYNAIVWQCRRTSKRCDAINKSKNESQRINKLTGLPVDAYFSATKIEWILKNITGAMKKSQKGELLFGTTDTWILWKLTGGKTHATDYTNASRTMLFDIEKKEWSKYLLNKFSVSSVMLPEVKRSSGEFGITMKQKGIPGGIPITGIAGDQQAALFGQSCFEKGMIKNTYGTGSFILMNSGENRPVSKYGLIATLGCGKKGEAVYVLEGSIFVAGSSIQWLRDGLKLFKDAKETENMAERAGGNAGVYFVPALVGLGAPYWDQDSRGSISGLTRGVTSDHIVRAALESICYQTKDVLDVMKKDTGLEIKDLRVDGGAVKNNFLCQFQSDILGVSVIRPKVIETTSLGAAYLAGLAVGYWKNSDEIEKCWIKEKVFQPKMNKKDAGTLYKGWQNAVNKVLTKKVQSFCNEKI
ncbi:MAG: glycerol kinase GlpK [Candidatus Omnitrophica bacterium]|nr:glycerol kinase GlpK [Candidatus Omnitrophota bacterium]